MTGKIALEEHFVLPETADTSYAIRDLPTPELRQKVLDVGSGRIEEMDRGGVEICILSHVAAGVQAVPNNSQAIALSRRVNDYLAEHIAKYPKRLKGFAALPLQDPEAASHELTRCIKELGLCGALVNGFSQIGEVDSAVFYDLPQYRQFWQQSRTSKCHSIFILVHPSRPASKLTKDTRGWPARPGDSRSKPRFTRFV